MSLMEAVMSGAGGGSVLTTMKFAVRPIAKVFTMCFMGFLMATNYIGILNTNGRKLLNGLVFSLLLPCLIFTQLGRAITVQKVIDWWYIPVNIVLGTVSASLVGLLVAIIVRPPRPYFKFTIVHIAIGNNGNMPLVLIAALCRDPSNPFGDPVKCKKDGNAYVSFGQWVGAIILYSYVFRMLAPPPGETFDGRKEKKLPATAAADGNAPEQVPLLTPRPPEHAVVDASKCSKAMDILHILIEKFKLKQVMKPPVIASALAMAIGATPSLKHFILENDAPLFFFTDACMILGEAMIPCILLALGGNLVDGPGPGSKKLGLRTTAAIIIGRLVLVPPAGLGVVTMAERLGLFPKGDTMFKFVLLLQHSMPTSVLSGAVASLRGCGEESAAVLFWMYVCAVFSVAGWMVLYIRMLF
ncbi:protein PIN-LIKES 6 [Lolium perenne]|uniref:protein PIN-LIKES 6 n=1 Tax=Lolium perenne TaxID=4522 RepID=UPI0021F664C2|nr:protein PIN-LIKES 6-like [Lolium perenne]